MSESFLLGGCIEKKSVTFEITFWYYMFKMHREFFSSTLFFKDKEIFSHISRLKTLHPVCFKKIVHMGKKGTSKRWYGADHPMWPLRKAPKLRV